MDVLQRTPETKTTPGLHDFLKRQRETLVPEPIMPGQSESPVDTDKALASADATKTEKKEKTVDDLKKELSSQAKASLRLGAERAELQRQLETQKKEIEELKAKAEGKFVPPSKEQQEQEAVLKAEFAKFEQRRDASKEDAIKEYGEEAVLSSVYVDDSPFQTLTKQRPWLVQRVIQSERPVHEMMTILAEEAVLNKFGRTEAAVLAHAESILKPKLFEQFKTEMNDAGAGAKPVSVVPSLNRLKAAGADARGGGDSVRTFSALNLNPHNRV